MWGASESDSWFICMGATGRDDMCSSNNVQFAKIELMVFLKLFGLLYSNSYRPNLPWPHQPNATYNLKACRFSTWPRKPPKSIPMWHCGPLGAFNGIVLTYYYQWIKDGSIGNLDTNKVVHKVIQECANREFHVPLQDFATKSPFMYMFSKPDFKSWLKLTLVNFFTWNFFLKLFFGGCRTFWELDPC